MGALSGSEDVVIKESAIVMLAWLTASKPRLEHLFGEHFHESPLSLLDFNTSVRAVVGNPCLKHSGNSARLAFAGELLHKALHS
jgi:hypothetical protein